MAQKTSIFSFGSQVRAEASKVVWSSRKEVVISSLMVVIMSLLAAIFFFIADQLMAYGVEIVLGFGR
jgi:preprotein translocase subunit SecE